VETQVPEISRFFGIIIMMFYMEWAASHKTELLENWELARQQSPLKKVQPLE